MRVSPLTGRNGAPVRGPARLVSAAPDAKMPRMQISVRSIALAGLLLGAAACSDPVEDAPPSILLVVIDTLRADAVSA